MDDLGSLLHTFNIRSRLGCFADHWSRQFRFRFSTILFYPDFFLIIVSHLDFLTNKSNLSHFDFFLINVSHLDLKTNKSNLSFRHLLQLYLKSLNFRTNNSISSHFNALMCVSPTTNRSGIQQIVGELKSCMVTLWTKS
jgi:hypothetical protein